MKKYVAIIATLVLLLLVFAPATYAQEADAQGGGYGGGWGDGGWQGGGWGDGGWQGGWGGGWNNCRGNCYRVRYGDTLFSIGRRYGVNPWEIARANGLHNPNWIYAGQWLFIPPARHPYPYGGNPAGYYGGGGCGYGGCGGYGGWQGGWGYGGGYDDGYSGY